MSPKYLCGESYGTTRAAALAKPLQRRHGMYLNGLILMEQGRLDEAVEAFRRSVYLDPDFALGNFALAGLFARMRQADRAGKALDNVTRRFGGLTAVDGIDRRRSPAPSRPSPGPPSCGGGDGLARHPRAGRAPSRTPRTCRRASRAGSRSR